MSIKDIQKWVMLRPKLDVSGYGDQNFRQNFRSEFCGRHE